MSDGTVIEKFVAQSLGNIHRPMTDDQLEAKFRDQAAMALPADRLDPLVDMCWSIDRLDQVGALVRMAVPE
jgi:2-methylcitrate dehydratase PrpD